MLWIVFVILSIMGVFGLATSYTLGRFIDVLLITAVAVLVIKLIQARRLW